MEERSERSRPKAGLPVPDQVINTLNETVHQEVNADWKVEGILGLRFQSFNVSSYTLAITGKVFELLVEKCSQENLDNLINCTSVFARMNPN